MLQDSCLFCKIIRGEIPCTKVYEDDDLLAFLDIAPVNPGHTLVIPKDHLPTLFDLPDEYGALYLPLLKRLGKAIMQATDAEGLNLMMNNYHAAGQMVDHAHMHLIPRYSSDGLTFWPQGSYEGPSHMDDMAQAIRKALI